MSENRLVRSEQDRVIAGVCGGIADYLNIDPVLVRVLFAVLFFASGIGLVLYVILWFIMPQAEGAMGGTAVLKENLDDMGHTVGSSAKSLSQPGLVGIILIGLGLFFLLNQLGVWGGWLWPLLIIGVGVYLLTQRQT